MYVASSADGKTIITDIFAIKSGEFTNISFSNESGTSVRTLRNYYVYADDIDMDGVVERAKADGFDTVIDGTNASDDAADRPGMKALEELGVLSPLRLCGLTKGEIRLRSKEAGLFTWNKPAYACLATRVPTGTEITAELLQKVDQSEEALRKLGYTDLRIRLFSGAARVQLPENQLKNPDIYAIREALTPFFDEILLDLRGR